MLIFIVSCLPKKEVKEITSMSSVSGSLVVTPKNKIITVNDTIQISPTSGTPPYTYDLVSNGTLGVRIGTLSNTGLYTAPGTAGLTVVIKVTDATGNSGMSFITVNDVLNITPTARVAVAGSTYPFWFYGSGGVPPYTFSVVSGGGTISSKGVYTAPATTGSALIRITDSEGTTRDAPVVINPTLSMFPTSLTRFVQANSSLGLSASGGLPPYTWSLVSGSGFVNGSTFFAPTASVGTGTVTLRVTDQLGATSDSTFSIIDPNILAISPQTRLATTLPNGSNPTSFVFAYSATGGFPPYTYSIVSGPGSITTNTGYFTPPNDGSVFQRTTTVGVTDSAGTTRTATVYLQPMVQATPATASIAAGTQLRIDGIGGICPYTFLVSSGSGNISTIATTNTNFAQGAVVCNYGLFVAPLSATTTTIRVVDAHNNYADSVVTITGTATASIQPTMTLSPATRVVATGSSTNVNGTPTIFQYTTSGGFTPYTYSIVSGPGSIGAQTGIYVPPTDNSSVVRTTVVRSTDALGAYRDAYISVNPTLSAVTTPLSPVNTLATQPTSIVPDISLPSTTLNRTIATNGQLRIDGAGGFAPFTYSILSGAGKIMNIGTNTSNYAQVAAAANLINYGLFTAPSTSGTTVIRVTDLHGNYVDSTITVSGTSLGALDTTYNSGDTQPGVLSSISFDSGDDIAQASALDSSGKLVVVGYSYNTTTDNYDFAVARVNSNGTIDTSFGTSGKFRFAVGSSDDYATTVGIQSDGKIVVGGYCQNGAGAYDFCVARLTSSGALDTTFNTTGYNIFPLTAGNYNEYAQSLAIQSDGKIVIGGSCITATTANNLDFCLARLTTAGVLDTTFNTTGKVISALAGNDIASSLVLQRNGYILLGGSCSTDFCIVRYDTTGAVDPSFGNGNTGRVVFTASTATAAATYTEGPIKMSLQTDQKILIGGAASSSVADYNYVMGRLNSDGILDENFGVEGRIQINQSVFGTGNSASGLSDFIGAIALQSDGKLIGAGRTFGNNLNMNLGLLRVTPDGVLDSSFGSNGRVVQNLTGFNGNAFSKNVLIQSDGKILVTGYAHNGTAYKFILARYWP